DPSQTDHSGRTALFSAIKGGEMSVVELILCSNTDINHRDSYGTVPLHLAVESGSEVLTLLLLERGADVNA
ncbi:ankyrin repeat-containing domain protein, partial [Colletotrichum cereale]